MRTRRNTPQLPLASGLSRERHGRCCDDPSDHDEGDAGAASPRSDTRGLGRVWHRDAYTVSQSSEPGRPRRQHDSDNHEEGREREHAETIRPTASLIIQERVDPPTDLGGGCC